MASSGDDDDMAEFDNLNQETQQTEVVNKKKEVKSGGIDSLMRTLSCLPCLPAYEEMPKTPNIDKLKEIFGRFKDSKTNEIDVNLVERSRSADLAEWTQKVVTFLPSVNGAPETPKETNQITNHFKTIKKFYIAVNSAGFESSELEVLFNALQIYESVMPLAFVMFHEHPRVMNSITSSIDQAIVKIEDHQNMGCFSLVLCSGALLTKFYSILSIIDQKIGEFNIASVCDFIVDIMEVFCRYFNIDLTDADKLATLADAIQELVKAASGKLKVMFGDLLPEVKRERKWGPLSITQKIRSKLAQFDTGSAIVERTMNSFEGFFKAVEGIDDRYERTRGHVARTAPVNGEGDFTEENESRIDF